VLDRMIAGPTGFAAEAQEHAASRPLDDGAASLSAGGRFAAAVWETSSWCAGGSCVQIARLDSGEMAVRDGKQGAGGPVLVFTEDEWSAFTKGVKAGEFE
jgi:hypothetical protein